jgi:hypothetical protein
LGWVVGIALFCVAYALRIRFACAWHALGICPSFPSHCCRFPRGVDPHTASSSPGIVFMPVMDSEFQRFAVKKTDLDQGTHKRFRFAIPLSRKFYILIAKAVEIAIPAVGGYPKEKTDQRPATTRT